MNTRNDNVETIYPLSPMQEGMLFHTLYAPKSGVYFIQYDCVINGELDISAFKHAWECIVARHAMLRTFVKWDRGEKPLQVVRRKINLPWQQEDWRGLPESEQNERLETLIHVDRRLGFEVSKAPLFRLILIR